MANKSSKFLLAYAMYLGVAPFAQDHTVKLPRHSVTLPILLQGSYYLTIGAMKPRG